MLIAKVAFKNWKEVIAEVVRQGRALFDPRPGWGLAQAEPATARKEKRGHVGASG